MGHTKTPPCTHDSKTMLMRSVRGQGTAERGAEFGVHVRNQTSHVSQWTTTMKGVKPNLPMNFADLKSRSGRIASREDWLGEHNQNRFAI